MLHLRRRRIQTISTIKLNGTPYSIAVNEETNRIYVGTMYDVIVFNGTTGILTTRYSVIVIDGTTKQILTTIPVNSTPDQIVVDAVNNKIFVRYSYENITVIDGVTNSIIGELLNIYTGRATDIVVDSERNLVYVGTQEDWYWNVNDKIQVYDEKTLKYLDAISIPGSASTSYHNVYVGLNSRLNRLYATWSGNSTIFMFDGATRKLLKTGQYTSPTKTIWWVDLETNKVYLNNETLDGNILEQSLPLILGNIDGRPVFDPHFSIVYAVRSNGSQSNSLYELLIADTLNNEVFATVSLAEDYAFRSPNIAVNTKTGEIYLTHSDYTKKEIVVVKGVSSANSILTSDLSIIPKQVEIGQTAVISFKN